MEIVKANQKDIIAILNLILKNSTPPEPALRDIAIQFNFPLKTNVEVHNSEKLLKESPTHYVKLVSGFLNLFEAYYSFNKCLFKAFIFKRNWGFFFHPRRPSNEGCANL